MGKEIVNELEFGVIERRIYGDDGKLVEIRKEYPPQDRFNQPRQVMRRHGFSAGMGGSEG